MNTRTEQGEPWCEFHGIGRRGYRDGVLECREEDAPGQVCYTPLVEYVRKSDYEALEARAEELAEAVRYALNEHHLHGPECLCEGARSALRSTLAAFTDQPTSKGEG